MKLIDVTEINVAQAWNAPNRSKMANMMSNLVKNIVRTKMHSDVKIDNGW